MNIKIQILNTSYLSIFMTYSSRNKTAQNATKHSKEHANIQNKVFQNYHPGKSGIIIYLQTFYFRFLAVKEFLNNVYQF